MSMGSGTGVLSSRLKKQKLKDKLPKKYLLVSVILKRKAKKLMDKVETILDGPKNSMNGSFSQVLAFNLF